MLAPDATALLAELNPRFPALGTEVTEAADARRRFEALRAAAVAPTPVGGVRDEVATGPDGGRLALRRYTPIQSTAPADLTILFLHGGGWVLGGLDSHDELVRRLANGTGATVVAVDYRLAPEHPFPAALHDAFAALEHVAAQGRDGASIVVCGDSAGANLAAALCMLARDEGGPEIAGQLLLYPMTDRACETASFSANGAGYYITAEHLRWFWSQYLRDVADGADPRASILHAPDLQGLPPAHVVTAEFDPLRDEGEEFARRLAAAGVPTALRRYDGAFHGFLTFYDQLAVTREAHAEIYEAALHLAGVTAHG